MVEHKKREMGEADSSRKKVKLDDENLKASHTLYIKNLNDKINRKTLKHTLYLLFSTYGDIIEINMNYASSRMRGQAHVVFGSEINATLAKDKLQNMKVFDKPMTIYYAKKKSKVIFDIEDEANEGNNS